MSVVITNIKDYLLGKKFIKRDQLYLFESIAVLWTGSTTPLFDSIDYILYENESTITLLKECQRTGEIYPVK